MRFWGGGAEALNGAARKRSFGTAFLFPRRGGDVSSSGSSPRDEDEAHRVGFVGAPSDSSRDRCPGEKGEAETALGAFGANDLRDQLDLTEFLREPFPRRHSSELARGRHRRLNELDDSRDGCGGGRRP